MAGVIFFDIDGVLLSMRMWAAAGNLELLDAKPGERALHLRFDPGAVGLLNRLAELTGAKLVLHSTWRRTWPHDREALRLKLLREGLKQVHFHEDWCAPEIGSKWHDVSAWLQDRPQDKALIIDDEPFAAAVPPGVAIGQILPNAEDGFGIADYRAALKFFEVEDNRVRSGPTATVTLLRADAAAAIAPERRAANPSSAELGSL